MEEDINLNNYYYWRVRDRVMMFNATFDNISVISLRSVFWGEKTGVSGKKPPRKERDSYSYIVSDDMNWLHG